MPLMSTTNWLAEMIERLNDVVLKYAGLNESGWKEVEPETINDRVVLSQQRKSTLTEFVDNHFISQHYISTDYHVN